MIISILISSWGQDYLTNGICIKEHVTFLSSPAPFRSGLQCNCYHTKLYNCRIIWLWVPTFTFSFVSFILFFPLKTDSFFYFYSPPSQPSLVIWSPWSSQASPGHLVNLSLSNKSQSIFVLQYTFGINIDSLLVRATRPFI